MNYETSRRLANLGKKIPRSLLKAGVKEINQGAEQKERIEKIVRTGMIEKRGRLGISERVRVNEKTQKMLRRQLEQGRFNNVKREVDHKVEGEISRAWDQIIASARRRGELPSAEEARVDYNKFMASRRK